MSVDNFRLRYYITEGNAMLRKRSLFLILTVMYLFLFSACSINRMAMRAVSDALTREGSTDVFTSDPDPQLVGDALPFAIKMYEALLAANPNHRGLLRTSGSLFIMYANAFVQAPAEQLPRSRFAERQVAMERARLLYLRGLEILYRGLELRHPGFASALDGFAPPAAPPAILSRMTREDVPFLYWAAVGGISAFAINPLDFTLSRRVPEFLALVERAYELYPGFSQGALDEFLFLFYASVPEGMGGDRVRARMHFERALEKSAGLLARPFVSYARVISIPEQDYDTFRLRLEAALAIDPDADPPNRLVNIIAQRQARHLLNSAHLYFFHLGFDDWDWDDDWYDDWDDEDW